MLSNFLNNIFGIFKFADNVKKSAGEVYNIVVDSSKNSAPSLSISLNSTKYTPSGTFTVVDLSWYAPYKQYGDSVIVAFSYLCFVWFIFRKLSNIISGAESGANDIAHVLEDYNLSQGKGGHYN